MCASGKAEKKKWKELKLLKKLEKQRMRELAEKQAEQAREEEQKEDRGEGLRGLTAQGAVRQGTFVCTDLPVASLRALTGTNTMQRALHNRPLLPENP